jgi:hypothetical protein
VTQTYRSRLVTQESKVYTPANAFLAFATILASMNQTSYLDLIREGLVR